MFKKRDMSIMCGINQEFFDATKGMCILKRKFPHFGSMSMSDRDLQYMLVHCLDRLSLPYKLCVDDGIQNPWVAVYPEHLDEIYSNVPIEVRDMLHYIPNHEYTIHWDDRRLNYIRMADPRNEWNIALSYDSHKVLALTLHVHESDSSNKSEFVNQVEGLWNACHRVASQFKIHMVGLMDYQAECISDMNDFIKKADNICSIRFAIELDDTTHSIDEMNALIAKMRLLDIFHGIQNPDRKTIVPFILDLEL